MLTHKLLLLLLLLLLLVLQVAHGCNAPASYPHW
jgi:hypothetical protein